MKPVGVCTSSQPAPGKQHGVETEHERACRGHAAHEPAVAGGQPVEAAVECAKGRADGAHQKALFAVLGMVALSRMAQSAGLRVRELKAEMTVAVATVTANWR